MSRDFRPFELHHYDKEFNFRKQTATWHLNGQTIPQTYEDGLTEIEKEYLNICPELIFLAQGILPDLKQGDVSDEFLINIEKNICEIEQAYDRAYEEDKPVNIPDKDTEPKKCLLKWWTNDSYHQDRARETLCNDLISLSDIERQAKQNVRDYLENMYDTMDEIR